MWCDCKTTDCEMCEYGNYTTMECLNELMDNECPFYEMDCWEDELNDDHIFVKDFKRENSVRKKYKEWSEDLKFDFIDFCRELMNQYVVGGHRHDKEIQRFIKLYVNSLHQLDDPDYRIEYCMKRLVELNKDLGKNELEKLFDDNNF